MAICQLIEELRKSREKKFGAAKATVSQTEWAVIFKQEQYACLREE